MKGLTGPVFHTFKSLFGGNVTVDTVLDDTHVTPGGVLGGEVKFAGIDHAHHVQSLSLALTARVSDNVTFHKDYEFHRVDVGTEFALEAGVDQTIPFTLTLPWETPMSSLAGRSLPGMQLGVITQLALRNAFDSSDLDPLVVEPLPVHLRVLSALDGLGFIFHRAELKPGSLPGSRLPFFQEIEYWAAGEYGMAFKALDLTFISSQAVTLVVIEMDRSAGVPELDGDRCFSITVSNDDTSDLTPTLGVQLRHLLERRNP